METWDNKSMSSRYLTNDEIDKTKIEILAEKLQRINNKLDSINFKRRINNDMNIMDEVYNKLIKQKEYIENKLQKR